MFLKKGVLFRTTKSAFFDKKGIFSAKNQWERGVLVTDEQGWALPIYISSGGTGF